MHLTRVKIQRMKQEAFGPEGMGIEVLPDGKCQVNYEQMHIIHVLRRIIDYKNGEKMREGV